MKGEIKYVCFVMLIVLSCGISHKNNIAGEADLGTIISVEAAHFTAASSITKITIVPCTLSDGTKAECYQISTNSTPADHPMGPWCPDHITSDASAGGIWLEDGEVHDVDGKFIESLAARYKDRSWKMYDADGKVYVTETEEDCINAANPNVGEEYRNFCVECIPSYIREVSRTWLIPVSPVLQTSPVFFQGGGRGPVRVGDQVGRQRRPPRPNGESERPAGSPRDQFARPDRPSDVRGGVPSTRGIALNGVEFSAPAPVNHILSAYTIAPFDDAGGHINVHQGYHYHAATGKSFSIIQSDGHAPLIGYAMDGHGIYAHLDQEGNEAAHLDECRGHYDEMRGYHYHVDAAGSNNFINCLRGAFAN